MSEGVAPWWERPVQAWWDHHATTGEALEDAYRAACSAAQAEPLAWRLWSSARATRSPLDGVAAWQALLAALFTRAGVDVNAARGSDGATVLHEAAAAGDPHPIDLLLRWGADAHALDHHDRTPLHRLSVVDTFEAAKAVELLVTAQSDRRRHALAPIDALQLSGWLDQVQAAQKEGEAAVETWLWQAIRATVVPAYEVAWTCARSGAPAPLPVLRALMVDRPEHADLVARLDGWALESAVPRPHHASSGRRL